MYKLVKITLYEAVCFGVQDTNVGSLVPIYTASVSIS